MIVIREGGKEAELSMKDAVMRSVMVGAAKGGVLHSRTFLTHVAEAMQTETTHKQAEQAKRADSFNFWREYCVRERAKLASAEAAGEELPQPLPHPDDILFDPAKLEIRFLGPIDDEAQAATERLIQVRDLVFELMIFSGEKNRVDEQGRASQLGLFGLFFRQATLELPPRLRAIPEELHVQIRGRYSSRREWARLLTAESIALGMPFRPTVKWGKSRSFSLDELGAEYCGDVLLPKNPAARRKHLRHLEEQGIDLAPFGFG